MNNPDVTEKLSAPATSAPASGSVAAMNNTDVRVDGIMLSIWQRGNPDNQMTAVLTKQQATRIIEMLSKAHQVEPPNAPGERPGQEARELKP